ncbi:lactate utilization protein B/C [Arachidicoccus ginsenosidimutans]|uniref:LutC/YkgG family protein n=1 Tax=Arachidicoccus sp. BS20 TaxID=1850526 RepID=UPI0007F0C25C|nr:LUD domain-containing protein [Arachidicoccus sp. BS20]ANI88755.1 lactate utilization protein B/C [Arachidicoccus sp. BS20]
MQSSKEQILNKIRKALEHSTPMPFPEVQSVHREEVVNSVKDELTVTFAESFSKVGGQFIYCSTPKELVEQLNALQQAKGWKKIFSREPSIIDFLQKNDFHGLEFSNFMECEVAVTNCEKLIARTGSILMSSAQTSGRTTSVYAPVHICIAFTNQLVYDIYEGFDFMQQSKEKLPSLITLATGPSRTADIEKTLVVGVHGPKEVFCFVVEEP